MLCSDCAQSAPLPHRLEASQKHPKPCSKHRASLPGRFLTSLAESPLFVRPDRRGLPVAFSPTSFIDENTQEATIALVSFSSQYGIGSYIKITAKFGPVVSVDFSISNIGGLQDGRLTSDRVLCILGLALCFVTLAYFVRLYTSGWYVKRFGGIRGALGAGLLDTVCLTLGPIVYLVIRLVRTTDAEARLTDTFTRLSALPWGSQTLNGDEKLALYADARSELESKLNEAQNYQTIGVCLALLMYDPPSSNHRSTGCLGRALSSGGSLPIPPDGQAACPLDGPRPDGERKREAALLL